MVVLTNHSLHNCCFPSKASLISDVSQRENNCQSLPCIVQSEDENTKLSLLLLYFLQNLQKSHSYSIVLKLLNRLLEFFFGIRLPSNQICVKNKRSSMFPPFRFRMPTNGRSIFETVRIYCFRVHTVDFLDFFTLH